MKQHSLAIALVTLLVGGVAVAAFQNNRSPQAHAQDPAASPAGFFTVDTRADRDDAALALAPVARAAGHVDEHAEVVRVEPVTRDERLYATVLGSEPVRESSTVSTPREVCEDVVVAERLPERDGNVGGTVAGAVIGGLVGSRIGGGNGRKAATVGGAVAGGFIGNRIDRNHVGGQVVERVERQCRTVMESSTASRVIAYNVTFRNPDGTTGTMRTDERPGNRIALGTRPRTVGYDVTYVHEGQERSVRMDERPGQRLPVVDGEVVTQLASFDPDGDRG
ncbi:MAG: glycine zipper 2TM domain-containing protein [Pseudoxanthomonas suwonensis]|nr:glycine zipper 2TM domain-containing protein [Pseudoxanthomonas suwonensis]